MKKIFLLIPFLSYSLTQATVLETSFKASFSPVTITKEEPVAQYNMGGQQFKVVMTDVIEHADGMETLTFDVYSIVDGSEILISQPMFKKEKDSLATLTLGKDEYSMTLSIR